MMVFVDTKRSRGEMDITTGFEPVVGGSNPSGSTVVMHTPAHWEQTPDGTSLVRTYIFGDFTEALAFVNRVGEIAEKLQHHPDIGISYSKVVLTLTTHDTGGLTDKDFETALKINEVVL